MFENNNKKVLMALVAVSMLTGVAKEHTVEKEDTLKFDAKKGFIITKKDGSEVPVSKGGTFTEEADFNEKNKEMLNIFKIYGGKSIVTAKNIKEYFDFCKEGNLNKKGKFLEYANQNVNKTLNNSILSVVEKKLSNEILNKITFKNLVDTEEKFTFYSGGEFFDVENKKITDAYGNELELTHQLLCDDTDYSNILNSNVFKEVTKPNVIKDDSEEKININFDINETFAKNLQTAVIAGYKSGNKNENITHTNLLKNALTLNTHAVDIKVEDKDNIIDILKKDRKNMIVLMIVMLFLTGLLIGYNMIKGKPSSENDDKGEGDNNIDNDDETDDETDNETDDETDDEGENNDVEPTNA